MRSMRLTILSLMGFVVLCAVWFAWFRRPTFHAASLAFTTALTVLLVASLGAIYGRRRTFWVGFVIFGWTYLGLAFAPVAKTEVRPYLITSHLLGDLANLMDLKQDITGTWYRTWVPVDSGLDRRFMTIQGERFQRIGHSLAAILHGIVGGLLAVFISSRGLESRRLMVTGPDPA